jgi:hypothetical protein
VERGELSQPAFEQKIAQLLGVPPTGLIQGLLADLRPEPLIAEAVASAPTAGIRVGVITNSWGPPPMIPTLPTSRINGSTPVAAIMVVRSFSTTSRPALRTARSTGSFVRSLRVIRRQRIAHPTVSPDQIAAIRCAIEELLTGGVVPSSAAG